jgi:hypothetical protein
MIGKALRGWRPGGLLAYLFGPGHHEEHRTPRVVASWDGDPAGRQPPRLAPAERGGESDSGGEFDLDLRALIAAMQHGVREAGLPLSNPPALAPEWEQALADGVPLPAGAPRDLARFYRFDPKAGAVVPRRGYVWHCPVRLHPDDPVLSDRQWEHIAHRLMTATGIDQAGCRWIAVRHADDHIHLVATLLSEDTGRRFHPKFDYIKLRKECRALEQELGLTRTPDIDWTAMRNPTRAELAKSARAGRTRTAREELRQLVHQCAATASSGEQFVELLRTEGLAPHTVSTARGEIRGYTVALPGDLTAQGKPVSFAGSSLAPDLSWPKLQARWATVDRVEEPERADDGRTTPAVRRGVLEEATATVTAATTALRAGREGAEGLAHAGGEVLAALVRAREGRAEGPLGAASDRFDRAARTPGQVVPPRLGPLAAALRRTSRRVGSVGSLTGRGHEKFALTALILALAALFAEIGAWQQQRGREHQGAAARDSHRALRQVATGSAGSRTPTRPGTSLAPSVRRQRRSPRRSSASRPRAPGSP